MSEYYFKKVLKERQNERNMKLVGMSLNLGERGREINTNKELEKDKRRKRKRERKNSRSIRSERAWI